jgi:hypothetical protein
VAWGTGQPGNPDEIKAAVAVSGKLGGSCAIPSIRDSCAIPSSLSQ